MPKLEQALEVVSKKDPFAFNLFNGKLDRNDPDFFDNLAMFYSMAGLSVSEYMEILREERRRFVDNYNGMDMS